MKLMIVDDKAVVRASLRKLLTAVLDAEIIEAGSARDALWHGEHDAIDVTILDIDLPDASGLAILPELVKVSSSAVLMLSMHANRAYIANALAAGATGYLTKSAAPAELIHAIREVALGRIYLEAELNYDEVVNLSPLASL